MTALLAVLSALVIGSSDFSGGVATRDDSTFRVTVWAQLWSGLTALALVGFVSSTSVTSGDIVAGALAGLSGSFSFVCFYAALSRGSMSIVAPTTAVVGAVVPAIVGVARGDSVGAMTAAGLIVAVVAIVVVTSSSGDGRTDAKALALAVVAGLGFSVFFIALSETHDAAGLWPLVVARVVSVPAVSVTALVTTGSLMPKSTRSRRLASYTGISEMLANIMLLVALRRGPLAVVSVFGSLYPVSTVILAWAILHEKMSRNQVIGICLATAALALVSV